MICITLLLSQGLFDFGLILPASAFSFISPEQVAGPIAIARKFSL
jgi:hypothetical protein